MRKSLLTFSETSESDVQFIFCGQAPAIIFPIFVCEALLWSFSPYCANELHWCTALVINLLCQGGGDLPFNFFFIVCENRLP